MRINRLILALAIWSVFGIVCLISEYVHAGYVCSYRQYERGECLPIIEVGKPLPPGLLRILTYGAGRAVTPDCGDVLALVAWLGEEKAEEAARSAGATEKQISEARRCLKSSSR